MKYPKLNNTPIKEIIFSISYDEIVDKDCFDKFVNLEFIKKKFKDIKPSASNELEISDKGIRILKDDTGFHLKNENEILQMRKGSLSYHYLNKYCDYDKLLNNLIDFWIAFDDITKDHLSVNNVSVRYINMFKVDELNPVSELIQLYPKQSKERKIKRFQNSVNFVYTKYPNYIINAVSTQPNDNIVLLDISVTNKTKKINNIKVDLASSFEPLQEVKNKTFFDSITANALIKYID